MRREAAREYLASALWAMPSLAVLLALVAGSALSSVHLNPDSALAPLLFQGTSDDARNLLIGIASTMVTVIALVLGLTVVALQLASTQFSPRLLRNFLRDLTNRLTLSTFVATFAYSTAGLYTVGISAGHRTDDYPRLAVSGALLLIFLSMVMLVFFVHHLAHSIQVDSVMQSVERATLHVISHSLVEGSAPQDPPNDPPQDPPNDPPQDPPQRPAGATAVLAPRSGYLQTLHPEVLVATLADHDLTATLVPMMGEHVVAGAPLLWAWPARGEGTGGHAGPLRAAAQHSIRLGYERTLEQDVAFGVRQLADVASKALSPAVNDPYTAVQAVDHLSVVLAALAGHRLGPIRLADPSGTERLHIPARDFDYLFDLALGQVRRYGASEPRVVRALLRVCRDIAWFCDGARLQVVRHFVEVLLDDVTRVVPQGADREPLLHEGRRLLAELAAPR